MKPNSVSFEEVLSDQAIAALHNEMSLVYWRLNDMNAYEKAGSKFNEGDWGLCIAVFSLGFMSSFIQSRLDPEEMPLHKAIYQIAEAKFFKAGWGENASDVYHLCWSRISENKTYQMFYEMGQVSSANKNGIVKDVVLMFMTLYDLLKKS